MRAPKKTKRQGSNNNHAEFRTGDAEVELQRLPAAKFTLIVTSPPYNVGKSYERGKRQTLKGYLEWVDRIVRLLSSKLTEDSSICWQVGTYVKNGELYPLDIHTYPIFKRYGFKLRNRIIWQFNFGLNSERRLSGRYETLLWFTKTNNYKFNLDAIRVPQLYPGKRHSRRKPLAGLPSGNPLGKTPLTIGHFRRQRPFIPRSSGKYQM